MVAVPADTPVTSPRLVTVATAVLEDTHGLEMAAVPLPVKVVLNPKHTDAVAGSNVGKAFTVIAAVTVHPVLFV